MKDRLLRSNDVRLLLTAARRGGLRLVISEVTLRETVNNTREQAHEALDRIVRAAASLRGLRVPSTDFVTELTAESVASEYEVFLRRELDRHRVGVLPVPQIPHDLILKRDLARRKPFDRNGRGYRDALIWETVRSLAEAEHEIAFVSANHRDFAQSGHGTSLASSLACELPATATVELWSDLKSFVETYVRPATDVIEHLRGRLEQDDGFRMAINDRVTSALDTTGADLSGIDPRVLLKEYGDVYELEDARLRLDDGAVNSLEVTNAHILDDDDQVVVDLDAVIRADLEFWLRRVHWNASQDDELLGEFGQGPPRTVHGASVHDLRVKLEGTYRQATSMIGDFRLVAAWTLIDADEQRMRRFRESRAQMPARREWERRAELAAVRWSRSQGLRVEGMSGDTEHLAKACGSVLFEFIFEPQAIRQLRGAAARLAVMRQMVEPDARLAIVTPFTLAPELAAGLASSLEPSIELYVLADDELV